MANPKIVYTDGSGATSFVMTYPPTGKPAFSATSQRNDVFSTAGVRQSTLMRTDQQYPISVPVILDQDPVEDGSPNDLDNWRRWLAFAQDGGTFQYFPDSEGTLSIACFLVETAVQLKRVGYRMYSFEGTFQQEVTE